MPTENIFEFMGLNPDGSEKTKTQEQKAKEKLNSIAYQAKQEEELQADWKIITANHPGVIRSDEGTWNKWQHKIDCNCLMCQGWRQ